MLNIVIRSYMFSKSVRTCVIQNSLDEQVPILPVDLIQCQDKSLHSLKSIVVLDRNYFIACWSSVQWKQSHQSNSSSSRMGGWLIYPFKIKW